MAHKYVPTIGIELHTQLATLSKMFCGCNNDSRDAEPNTNVCPVCMALPGALPTINKGAVELAIRLGYGLNAQIASNTSFDRKNYFYPDSPKGYQITQMDQPIIIGGEVQIFDEETWKTIRIHHAHLEEDAGKSTHPKDSEYTLVDFNRAGTPLVEIVSEPDMHTPAEARKYLQEIYAIATTLGVTHGDMEHGNFKFDLNVSVSDTPELGTRTELKNLNSFRNAERALHYEIQRQIDVLEGGQAIDQETRGWNDAKGQTFSQRGKEHAHDYRYFPEPDLPPLYLQEKFIQNIQSGLADITLPIVVRKSLLALGLSTEDQDTLLAQAKTRQIFDQCRQLLANKALAKKAVNWLSRDYQAWLSEHSEQDSKLSGKHLAELVELVEAGGISSKIAKDIFVEVVEGKSPKELVQAKGLAQISDDSALEAIILAAIEANTQAVADYKSGNSKAAAFFVGYVMKETKGQANPSKANALVLKLLEEQ